MKNNITALKMSSELEKFLKRVEIDIKKNQNISKKISSKAGLIKYLDSL